MARGSGLSEGEIKEMIKQYNTSKSFMKQNKGRGMGGFFRKFGLG
jgi:signal recognition particle subunit SRP54